MNSHSHNSEAAQPLLGGGVSRPAPRPQRRWLVLGALCLAFFSGLGLLASRAAVRLQRSTPISTSPAALFAILAEVAEWPQWDEGLETAELFEQAPNVSKVLAPGVRGRVIMKQRGAFDFQVKDVDPEGLFSYVTEHPAATTAVWFWEFPAAEGSDGKELVLTTGVELSGPGAYPFKWYFGDEALSEFEKVCKNLKRIAESK